MTRSLSVREVMKTIGSGASNKRNEKLVEILEELDRDGSGQIDVTELVSLLEGVANSRRERKYMCLAIVAMFIFGIVLIGAIIGLSYAMMYALKDTEVKGGVMYVKGSDGLSSEIVRTGSAEFVVQNGTFVQRVEPTISGSAASTPAVLRTAAYMGTPQPLTSQVDLESLLELKYLLIKGTGDAQLGLVVQGVARVPQQGSVFGTVLHIVTAAGTITLDGTIITFSNSIADIFTAAGFRVSNSRRVLLGAYNVLGFFNTIKQGSVFGTVLHIVTAAGTITLDGTIITFSNSIADIFTAAGFRVSNSRRVLLGAYNVLGFFNTIKDLSASGKPPAEPEPKLPTENFVMKLKIYEPCVTPDQPDNDRCKYTPPSAAGSTISPTQDENADLAGVTLYNGVRYMAQ
ncbi:hypothetical protein GPECTOR_92g587 [Gonium pectorale]|uniref:EF-hand domain-containing protein n=1 Tax=Gonium pectorale TaxID=33097 RepID=A0A150G0J6_GONPE|nr:hypothetical protein GPECTOR_92g587 [Gonium pectorale]|eukprot:KXZ43364.1 hypothetical protein GPECTOR_92g587 [Gonium pectorale]